MNYIDNAICYMVAKIFIYRYYVSMGIINNISFQNNDRVKQFGKTDDGRIVVGVRDIDSGKYVKSTIPEENFDEFERFSNETQDKYGKICKNNFQMVYAANISGAILGGAITATCLKKASKTKTFFGTMWGALAGVVASNVIILSVIIAKIANFAKTAKNLDIKPYHEPVQENIDEKSAKVKEEDNKVEKAESNKETENKENKNEKLGEQ